MMPRQPAIHRDSLFALLYNSKQAILLNSKIATPSSTIWTELSQQLENKMSPKALYTFVKTNRHNIWSCLDINEQESDSDRGVDTECDSGSISPGQDDCSVFQLEVPFEDWIKFVLVPEKVAYSDKFSSSGKREYMILKPGTWKHVINHLMWKKIKSTCTFVFQRAKVYPTVTSNYMDIQGFCKECQGQVKMTCDREPTVNSPMVLQCSIEDTDISLHTRQSKRFMSGNLRAQISKDPMEPAEWRSAKASDLMDIGDPEPSHLPTLATLRNVKQERRDLELDDKDPILSLQLLKHSTPHSGSIRDIGLDKFFCHYWSPTQLHVYNTLSRKCPSVVCFDATGSVVRRLVRPNGTSGHIFLYQGVLKGDDCSVPVVQMLSERRDVNAIAAWLTEWRRTGAAVPNEAVSDFSLTILGALVKAFTPYPDLKAYINECLRVLVGNQSAKLPPCFIRVDVAHCIKMICQWDCLTNKSHRVKDFFVRAIAKLLQSQCLAHAIQLIHAITVVALSEAEGDDSSGVPLESERCKRYLKTQIAEDSIIIPAEDTKEVHQVEPLDEIQTDLRDWVSNICENSRSLAAANGDRDNIHFLPEIVPHIIRLASYLPLWTGVMVPLFKSTSLTASSATVDAEFKDVKHGLFKHENLPVRLDRFISRHLSFIEGNMRIGSAQVKEETSGLTKVPETNSASMSTHSAEAKRRIDSHHSPESDETNNPPTDEDVVENWRGLTLPPKKGKRTSYLTSCTKWLHADSSFQEKRVKVELLENGNQSTY